MANVVKASWFGTQVSCVLVNGKTVTGEVSEVSDNYIVLARGSSQVQIMVAAIVMIVPVAPKEQSETGSSGEQDSGPALFE